MNTTINDDNYDDDNDETGYDNASIIQYSKIPISDRGCEVALSLGVKKQYRYASKPVVISKQNQFEYIYHIANFREQVNDKKLDNPDYPNKKCPNQAKCQGMFKDPGLMDASINSDTLKTMVCDDIVIMGNNVFLFAFKDIPPRRCQIYYDKDEEQKIHYQVALPNCHVYARFLQTRHMLQSKKLNNKTLDYAGIKGCDLTKANYIFVLTSNSSAFKIIQPHHGLQKHDDKTLIGQCQDDKNMDLCKNEKIIITCATDLDLEKLITLTGFTVKH